MDPPLSIADDSSLQKLDQPWYAAYPAPRHEDPASIHRSDVMQWFHDGRKPGLDFIIVDLRRADHEGGAIHGSINLPAQSLHPTIPTLYSIFAAAKIEDVVWYCGEVLPLKIEQRVFEDSPGSSHGRGNRVAGWFADHIEEQEDKTMKSFVLEAGIEGWAHAGEDYVKLIAGYKESAWKK